MNPIHTEERDGFTLSYRAFPEEDISPEDSFDIQDGDDTLERIEDGTYAWFRVEITASRAGIDLATAHLGGCCYDSEEAFVTDSGYYADLCNEAIAEAKAKLAELDSLVDDRDALHDALCAAVAFVELYTGNGCRQQPPAWALSKDGDGFDAEIIAKRGREALKA